MIKNTWKVISALTLALIFSHPRAYSQDESIDTEFESSTQTENPSQSSPVDQNSDDVEEIATDLPTQNDEQKEIKTEDFKKSETSTVEKINPPLESIIKSEPMHSGQESREYQTPTATTQVPLVEVEKRLDVYAPYRERRKKGGFNFGISMENYQPTDNYKSVIDGQSFSNVFGKVVSIANLELGYKYNFIAGGILLNAGYGSGSISSTKSGANRTFDIGKTSLGLTYFMDALASEPYFVPYAGAKVWRLSLGESAPSVSASVRNDTGLGYNYTAGVLLQLNWIDQETATEALVSHGLENTFLDVFMTQYTKSTVTGDPDVSTGSVLGAGLRLEF